MTNIHKYYCIVKHNKKTPTPLPYFSFF